MDLPLLSDITLTIVGMTLILQDPTVLSLIKLPGLVNIRTKKNAACCIQCYRLLTARFIISHFPSEGVSEVNKREGQISLPCKLDHCWYVGNCCPAWKSHHLAINVSNESLK